MKIKTLLTVASVALVTVFTFSSCQSKEDRFISNYESLCDEIEADDDIDKDDISKYVEEYKNLQKQFEECNFSTSQREKVAEISGRFATIMTSKMPGMLMNNLGDIFKGGTSILKGLMKGMNDAVNDMNSELDDAQDEIDDELDEADEEIDKAMEEIDHLFD